MPSKTEMQQIAKEAMFLLRPAVDHYLTKVAKRHALHIVPFMRPTLGDEVGHFKDWVLAESSIRNDEWTADYREIAWSKGKISWRTGWDSDIIQIRAPHLLHGTDTQYWGSRVIYDLGCSCSGVESHNDRTIAGLHVETMIGLAAQNRHEFIEKHPDADFFDGRTAHQT